MLLKISSYLYILELICAPIKFFIYLLKLHRASIIIPDHNYYAILNLFNGPMGWDIKTDIYTGFLFLLSSIDTLLPEKGPFGHVGLSGGGVAKKERNEGTECHNYRRHN